MHFPKGAPISPRYAEGDEVQLKSGGPRMTVASLEAVGDGLGGFTIECMCEWFVGAYRESATYPEDALEAAADVPAPGRVGFRV
ncbi:MAG: DUF2158 domain-containing protein [Gemmatimonadota bacterium]